MSCKPYLTKYGWELLKRHEKGKHKKGEWCFWCEDEKEKTAKEKELK